MRAPPWITVCPHQLLTEIPSCEAEYMAAPERFAKRQIPLAPRAPSIHGPKRRFAAAQRFVRNRSNTGHRRSASDRVNFHWAGSIFSSYGAIACKGRAPGRAPVSTLGSHEELVRAAGFQKFPQLNIKSPTKLFYAARPRSRARQRSVVGRSLPFAVDRRNPGSIRGSICGYKSRRIPN